MTLSYVVTDTTSYKGYVGTYTIIDDGSVYGMIFGILDHVAFRADTVAEAEAAFRKSVDDYLKLCARLGEEPCPPPRA